MSSINSSKKLQLTEVDIIRTVVKKRNFQAAYDYLAKNKSHSNSRELSSKDRAEERNSQFKVAFKVWQSLCKTVQSQMDKGRVVDTLYFGTFARGSSLNSDSDAKNFVYCPGPKAILKLVENEDNVAEISQPLLDERLSTVSTAALADFCGQTAETVQNILAGVRDEIVDVVMVRKNNATLNFGFGSLALRHNGTVEFKSQTPIAADFDTDKIPASAEFDQCTSASKKPVSVVASNKKPADTQSQQSITERSINFLQQRQASQQRAQTSDAKSRPENKRFTMSAQAPKPTGTNSVANVQTVQDGQSKLKSSRETASQNELAPLANQKLDHLNSFLKQQIHSAHSERRSNSSRSAHHPPSGHNNAMIEEAARIKAKGGDRDQVIDYLRTSTSGGQGVSLFQNKNVGLSKIKITNKQVEKPSPATVDAAQNDLQHAQTSDMIFLGNRQAHTNMLQKFNGTVSHSFDPETFGHHESKTPIKQTQIVQPSSAQESKSQRDLQRIIQKALNRKQISQAYHTNMPVFLRSDGPFSYYDHSLRYGHTNDETKMTVTDKAALAALQRYEKDLMRLKHQRESEKNQFYHNINLGKAQAQEAKDTTTTNLKLNQTFINQQREWNRQQRAEDKFNRQQYYKPHYGPEEDEEVIHRMNMDNARKTAWNYNSLVNQLSDQNRDNFERKNNQDAEDLNNLRNTLMIQQAENDKLRHKEATSKANMRQAWLEQMAYKKVHKQTDNFFQ